MYGTEVTAHPKLTISQCEQCIHPTLC